MRLQFSITICLSFFTAGWYVVTKVVSAVFCFCCFRADCLESGKLVTFDRDFSIYFFITRHFVGSCKGTEKQMNKRGLHGCALVC